MFKENKYYGEVWFADSQADKSFCTLELINSEVLITTNLAPKIITYQVDIIYGAFNGLGYLTFVNCLIKSRSSNMVQSITYEPKYTFISHYHTIDPINLKTNQFQVDNAAIVGWIGKMHFFNSEENRLEKETDVIHKTDISQNLSLTITKTTSYTSNLDFFRLDNIGYVDFKSESHLKILECIELYNSFQKLLHFIYGKSVQFKSFKFRCLGCDEWVSLYYKDDFTKENIASFITIDYDTIENDLSSLIKHWYNDKDIGYCADIIIENLLSVKTSNSRRFTNSYSAFEAYSYKYGKSLKNSSTKKYLLEHKEILAHITNIPEAEVNIFVSKLIRHRDYLVHRTKTKNNIFSHFDLLYRSFLLDYVVAIGLMIQMNVSDKIIEKIIARAKSTYQDMQSVNKLLNKDILET